MRVVTLLAVAVLVTTASAFYEGKSAVVTLTPENFEEKVIKSDGLWLVEFYAPWCGHCKQLTPNYEKAAEALKGSVNFGAVDADTHRALGTQYNVNGFPTIKFFGDDKSKPVEYEGGRSAEELVKTVLGLAKKQALDRVGLKDAPKEEPKKEQQQQQKAGGGFYDGTDVVELTDETFESEVMNPNGKGGWLVEFYAPWCGHCKNLAPAWKAAATQLAGAMHIAAIDATAHKKFAEKYQVNGFPTIKFFPPGGENPEDYNGGRSTENIVAFGMEKSEKYPMAPVVVNQLENQEALEKTCKDKNMCVVFVVPHVIDTTAAGRNKMLEMFASIYSKLRSRGVGAGWIVGGEHTKFEEGFGVFSTYPTYIAFNPTVRKRDGNYVGAVHKGTFNEAGLLASLKSVLDGKVGTTFKSLPTLSKGVPLWDGKDYVASDDE